MQPLSTPPAPQLGVVSPTFLSAFASSSALLTDLLKELKPAALPAAPGGGGGGGDSALRDTLQATPETGRSDVLVEFISGEVAKILALDGPSDVDPTQP